MTKITDLLQEKNCVVNKHIDTWQDAIHLACKPMIEQGYCDEQYVDAIFESTAKYGPYYVLVENLALIHATNKVGVYGTQLAVTVLDEPIKFSPDSYDVRILITLVAKDSTSHMEGMRAISEIFSDPEKVNTILNAKSGEEVYNLFIS